VKWKRTTTCVLEQLLGTQEDLQWCTYMPYSSLWTYQAIYLEVHRCIMSMETFWIWKTPYWTRENPNLENFL
jgi:hypothetical protein